MVPLLVVGLLLVSAAAARAQDAPPQPDRGRIEAVAIEGAVPAVDGRLDEAAWQSAPAASGFIQRRPNEGAPATARTEVRFLYGDEALYVGARMYSDAPAAIQAPVSRRDNGEQAEHLLISLDSYLDRRTAHTFGVTAAGTRLDWYHPADSEAEIDESFDPVWEAEVQRDSLGWTAEMRIPFSQLRFNRAEVQAWGLNIRRWIPTRNEESYWVMIPRDEPGWASRFGVLTGLNGIEPGRRIELLPYVAGGAQYTSNPGEDNPFNDGSSLSTRVGGNVKIGLGPNLTLEGTVNPDFGQVELDPAVVNLSAFEIFFPERRPFFVEGSQLLEGNGPTYFYSRRIGAPPRVGASGDYVDFPETTTILGAGKLTGRLASGTAIGALAAVTDREYARTWDAGTGELDRVPVSPLTGYGVLRAQQELGPSSSTVGVLLTGVRRDLSPGGPLAPQLNREAYAGGADWNLRFRNGAYVLSGYAGFSHIVGDSMAILRAQQSSARYFQRPDADHVELDPSRTSLSGYAGSLGLAKRSGQWLWEGLVVAESPGFEINDAGALGSADEVFGYANVTYRQTQPRGVLRDYQIGLNSENSWNFDGTRTFAALRTDMEATWKNFWRTELTAWIDFRARSDRLTRGGPLMGIGQAWVTILQVYNSRASRTQWQGRIYYGENELGERTYRLSGGLSFRPDPRWQFSIDPNYLRYTDPRQYVATVDGGPAETFGKRYVFSFLDGSELGTQLRLSYLFTPDLSLEVYAEPFVASGRFHRIGELRRAGGRALRPYGTDGTRIEQQPDGSYRVRDGEDEFTLPDGDFNVRSFRSNAVLRWEWRPGSTLYLVWQQDRFGEERRGDLIGPADLWDTFRADGDNLFALKVSYWIPIR